MSFTDAHTHLNADPLYQDRNTIYERFIDAGGTELVTVGMSPLHNKRAIEIATATANASYPIKITLGIHPYEIASGTIQDKQTIDAQMQLIEQQIQEHSGSVVAVGECGIDAHYNGYQDNKDLQVYAFHKQCTLAQKTGLPVVIHSRDQFENTYEVIKQYPTLKVYFHCRGYGATEIEKLHAILPSLWVGFCGNTTYKKAIPLRESLQAAWRLRDNGVSILMETDAPYLAPQQKRGHTNEPSFIQYLYTFVADELDISLTDFCNTVENSRHELYTT